MAPWHLATLSGLLVAFDVFAGQNSVGADGGASDLLLPRQYVERAKALLDIVHGMKDAFVYSAIP